MANELVGQTQGKFGDNSTTTNDIGVGFQASMHDSGYTPGTPAEGDTFGFAVFIPGTREEPDPPEQHKDELGSTSSTEGTLETVSLPRSRNEAGGVIVQDTPSAQGLFEEVSITLASEGVVTYQGELAKGKGAHGERFVVIDDETGTTHVRVKAHALELPATQHSPEPLSSRVVSVEYADTVDMQWGLCFIDKHSGLNVGTTTGAMDDKFLEDWKVRGLTYSPGRYPHMQVESHSADESRPLIDKLTGILRGGTVNSELTTAYKNQFPGGSGTGGVERRTTTKVQKAIE